ncbi:hypothetical protein Avbf_09982 [Armadillidium vulgare]|nr:hypothetical protein Avbf_09982 [Armadillidium vulgare]
MSYELKNMGKVMNNNEALIIRNLMNDGIIRKNKKHVKYSDVSSAIKLVPHGTVILIPSPPQNLETDSSSDADEHMEGQPVDDINTYQPTGKTNQTKHLNQAELND